MTELVQFDVAYRAIMAAKSIDEVKVIHDKMEALRLYLKQQGEGLDMQNACAEIRLRAARKVGELLKEMPKNEGAKGQLNGRDSSGGFAVKPPEDDAPTLSDLGLTKTQSFRFQAIASIPEEIFEAQIAEATPSKKELTNKQVLDAAKKESNRLKRQERTSATEQAQPDTRIEAVLANIYHGDFRQVCKERIADNSIDVIITDPPYPEKYLSLYEALAQEAARILKPGGYLLAMCGQSYFSEVLALMNPYLTYHWLLSYQTPGGQSAQIWPREINTFWKPVVWFVKGEYQKGDWHGDVIKSDPNDNDKRFHDWGQSESGFSQLVERFTLPGDLILDPFLGGGTTGVVALGKARRFIGIDTKEENIKISKERIIKLLQENLDE